MQPTAYNPSQPNDFLWIQLFVFALVDDLNVDDVFPLEILIAIDKYVYNLAAAYSIPHKSIDFIFQILLRDHDGPFRTTICKRIPYPSINICLR